LLVPLSQLGVGVQHPPQEVVVHRHRAVTHWRPKPHCAPVPQLQDPAAEQLSALMKLQAMQAFPFKPQEPKLGGDRHVVTEQHPVGQDVASQTQFPAVHFWPRVQATFAPQ
jgi:hypothetical protein